MWRSLTEPAAARPGPIPERGARPAGRGSPPKWADPIGKGSASVRVGHEVAADRTYLR